MTEITKFVQGNIAVGNYKKSHRPSNLTAMSIIYCQINQNIENLLEKRDATQCVLTLHRNADKLSPI